MSNELGMGKKVGAALAFSAAIMLAPHAHAMSELEELMGEPVEALSDNELSELRGGFVSVNGLKVNIGLMVRETVDGVIQRHSTANIQRVGNQVGWHIQNHVNREEEIDVTPPPSAVQTSVVDNAPPSGTDNSIGSTSSASQTPPPVETASGMTFNTADDSQAMTQLPVGASAQSVLSSVLSEVQDASFSGNNSNVKYETTLDLSVAGYAVYDAFAARARVESKISNIVNSQVLFSLGQQF